MGRVSWPVLMKDADLENVLYHPRFSVSRIRADGSVKIRAVDHMSWGLGKSARDNSVNGHTTVQENMQHEPLNRLAEVMRRLKKKLPRVLL